MADHERSLLDYAYVLLKWRRLIAFSTVGVAVVAAVVSLLLPQRWTARTTLLPPEEDVGQLWASSLLGAAAPPNLTRLLGAGNSSDRLLTMLASQRVLGAIVDSFSLGAEYGVPTRDLAIMRLDEHVDRERGDDGALHIAVTASSPELAAALCNALASELDEVNREYKSLQARSLKVFLENRAEAVSRELASAGDRLRAFQEQHRLVDLEEQTAAIVDLVKGIARELALKQAELGVSQRLLGPEHEQRQRETLEASELARQFSLLADGADGGPEAALPAGGAAALGPALMRLPGLAQEYAALRLEVEVKEAVLGYLRTQLEEARCREARDTPTLLVLDPATPPSVRSAPRRTLIVLVATALALAGSVLAAFALESAGCLAARHQERLQDIRALFGA